MLVTVSAVQVDHAGQALSQPQSRPGHQQVSTINIIQSYIDVTNSRPIESRRNAAGLCNEIYD